MEPNETKARDTDSSKREERLKVDAVKKAVRKSKKKKKGYLWK